ncbi:MAG: ABC transporter permease [Planctomycetota bacterium]|nr:ABC transporter permease [Planctomycetota bacterium]
MIALIARRLLQLPLILGAVLLLTLALAWGVPGNPLERAERRPPAEVEAAMRAQYRLDSFWSFAWSYTLRASGVRYAIDARRGEPMDGRDVFDLGPSLQYRDQRVADIIVDALPVSVSLGAAAIALALVIGVGAGVAGAVRPGGVLDALTLSLALVGISLPTFVVGTALLALFAIVFGWAPVGGWGSLRSMLLPAATLSLPYAAYIARLTRVGMIEALRADYVRTARAKGLPERTVIFRHALRNALVPTVSYLGPACAGAMTGSFVVETVFSVPGMGQHFVSAVQNKDLFLLMGVVLVYAVALVLLNLAADVLVRVVDPRVS